MTRRLRAAGSCLEQLSIVLQACDVDVARLRDLQLQRAQVVDKDGDQFSLCVSAWHTLQAIRPYAGETTGELLESMDAGEVRWGEEALPGVPKALEEVLIRGMHVDPAQRYRSMEALIEALSDALEPPAAGAEPLWERRWVHVAVLGGVLCLVFGVVLGSLWAQVRAPRAGEAIPELEVSMPAESLVDVVVRSIQRGEYDVGLVVWEGELERRELAGEPIAPAALRVGWLLLEHGEAALGAGQPKLASDLAKEAKDASLEAYDELWANGESTDEAVELLGAGESLDTRASALISG